MSESYKTKDIFIAATLNALDINPSNITITYTEGRMIAFFEYEDKDKVLSIIQDYFENKLRIEPLKLFNSLKSMKSRIYSN